MYQSSFSLVVLTFKRSLRPPPLHAFVYSQFRIILTKRRDFVNSCPPPPHLHFPPPPLSTSALASRNIHPWPCLWRSVCHNSQQSGGQNSSECAALEVHFNPFYHRGGGGLNVPDGWMDQTSHICLRAAGEGGGSCWGNPSAKVLKRSVGRQEIANCISFESFIKENAKRVELSPLYIQLQSTRRRIQRALASVSETHASRAIQFTTYPGRHRVISSAESWHT